MYLRTGGMHRTQKSGERWSNEFPIVPEIVWERMYLLQR